MSIDKFADHYDAFIYVLQLFFFSFFFFQIEKDQWKRVCVNKINAKFHTSTSICQSSEGNYFWPLCHDDKNIIVGVIVDPVQNQQCSWQQWHRFLFAKRQRSHIRVFWCRNNWTHCQMSAGISWRYGWNTRLSISMAIKILPKQFVSIFSPTICHQFANQFEYALRK